MPSNRHSKVRPLSAISDELRRLSGNHSMLTARFCSDLGRTVSDSDRYAMFLLAKRLSGLVKQLKAHTEEKSLSSLTREGGS